MIELIINPVAGNGLAKKIGQEAGRLLEQRGIEHRFHLTEAPGHATVLAREAAQRGAETVIAFGGDGTLTETAAGLRGTRTALGIVPAGTGNDFVKTVGTPRHWREALEFVLNHPARPVNTGLMNGRFFLNVCGIGFDVMVLDYAQKAKKRVRGIWPYLYGVLRAVAAFRPKPMRVTLADGISLEGEYMICTVANGRYIGGGIPIVPGADVTDGLLNVQIVKSVPRWRIPFYLPALLSGKLASLRFTQSYLARQCVLCASHMRLNLDGEILPVEEARFACETDALLLHW